MMPWNNARFPSATRCGALAIAVLLGAATPRCWAQGSGWGSDRHPVGQFGAHAGWMKARDAHDGNILGGLHLEFMPLPTLGVQGTVDFRNDEKFRVTGGTVDAALNVRTIPITVSGKLYVPVAPRFSPYGLVGAGWYLQQFDYSSDLEALGFRDRDHTTFGWHMGVGANIALQPRLGMFGEARWILLDPDQQLTGTEVGQHIDKFDFDSVHVLGGLSLLF